MAESTADAVIDKARKLLQLRERAATPGEAQAAAHALAMLLEKHRLEEVDLSLGAKTSEPFAPDGSPLIVFRRLPRWKNKLIKVLCRHYGVGYYRNMRAPGDRGEKSFQLFGKSEDIAMVRYMFGWLSVETDRLSHASCHGLDRTAFASWRDGFVEGIAEQLELARQMADPVRVTAALVLRERFHLAMDAMEKTLDLSTYTTRSTYAFDAQAHAQGRDRGRRQHLGEHLEEG